MFTALFRGARRRAARQSRAAARRPFVPRLEALEDRCLPSTLTVTNLADSGRGSLRGQLAAAFPGDTIVFQRGLSGTIALRNTLTLDRNVSVVGSLDAGGNPLVTLTSSGRDGTTDLAVNPGVTASVSGLTLTGATEKAVFNRGSLTLSHVAVAGNQIGYWVGPGYSFRGTIYNEGGLVVQDSRITNNTVNVSAYSVGADGGGGGIWNAAAGTLTVANSTVADNAAPGGVVTPGYTYGGGICNFGGIATITGSTLTGNSASAGGGIYSTGGRLTATACTISGNTAQYGNGGGIYGYGNGPSAISGSTISGNTAQCGGGIYFGSNGWTLANSTVANNRVSGSGRGGGIFVNQRTAVTVTNSTITGNTAGASGMGGGIYVSSGSTLAAGGTLTLLNSTVANNQTAGAGGGLWVGATRAQVRLANSIVAGNTAATGGPDVSGPLLSASAYNLIGNGSGASGLINGTNGSQVGTAASPIDPRLGPLQDNGGPTQTMALLAGSAALNAGDPAQLGAADQRGVVRSGGVNIGAYQASASAFALTAPATVTAGTPFDVTVKAVDAFGQVAVGYTGAVTFTATDTDAAVVLPVDYVFTAADQGTHTFSAGFVLITPGDQTLTAADPGDGFSASLTFAVPC